MEILPKVDDMFGIDLRTSTYIVGILNVAQMFFWSCTILLIRNKILVLIWILCAINSLNSIWLIDGIKNGSESNVELWLYFSLIYLVLMMVLSLKYLKMIFVYQDRPLITLLSLGIIWLLMSVYFFVVVNSYLVKTSINKTTTTAITFTQSISSAESTTVAKSSIIAQSNTTAASTTIAKTTTTIERIPTTTSDS